MIKMKLPRRVRVTDLRLIIINQFSQKALRDLSEDLYHELFVISGIAAAIKDFLYTEKTNVNA